MKGAEFCPDIKALLLLLKMGERKEEYDFYKSLKICVRCHKNTAEPHKIMCLECADKEKIADKKKREKNLEIVKAHDLDKYYRLKEQGICTYCKHRAAVPGKTKCVKCLAKIKAKRDLNRKDISRSERVSYGICYICGKDKIIDGHGVCEECYKVRIKAMDKCLNSRQAGFNDYWKNENKIIFARKVN